MRPAVSRKDGGSSPSSTADVCKSGKAKRSRKSSGETPVHTSNSTRSSNVERLPEEQGVVGSSPTEWAKVLVNKGNCNALTIAKIEKYFTNAAVGHRRSLPCLGNSRGFESRRLRKSMA